MTLPRAILVLLQVHTESKEHQASVIKFVEAELSGVLTEAHIGNAKFALNRPGQTIAALFRKMETLKRRLGIKEYGLSQPSLEQVFMTVVGSHTQT